MLSISNLLKSKAHQNLSFGRIINLMSCKDSTSCFFFFFFLCIYDIISTIVSRDKLCQSSELNALQMPSNFELMSKYTSIHLSSQSLRGSSRAVIRWGFHTHRPSWYTLTHIYPTTIIKHKHPWNPTFEISYINNQKFSYFNYIKWSFKLVKIIQFMAASLWY